MNNNELFNNFTQAELPSSFKERLDQKQITEIAFSPNGSRLAAGGEDRIWVYDLENDTQIAMLAGHTDRIRALAFAQDNNTLASTSDDSTLRLWNVDTANEIVVLIGVTSNLTIALASSPDGVPLAAWNEETARMFSGLTVDPARIRALAFSSDGETLISGGTDGKIRVWEVETGRQLSAISAHDGLVLALAFSPDGKLFASSGSDATVRLWDLKSEHLLSMFTAHSDSVNALAFSMDGQILVSGGRDAVLRLWNVKAMGLMSTIAVEKGFVWELAFWESDQTNQQQLVSVSRDGTLFLRE